MAGCVRPAGPDPFAGLLLYPNEIKTDGLYEGDVPLRAWVGNWGDKPFTFSGELKIERDGVVIDTIAFGQIASGGEAGKTVTVQEVCGPSQSHVYTATIHFASSITAPPDTVDVDMDNNTETITDACQLIYEQAIEKFCHDCVARINSLRALESLPALARAGAQRQACSDVDAKTNFDAGDPHKSQCGQAQNTCSPYGKLDQVLNDCVEAQMYHLEKVNYQADPNNCYNAKWPKTCGHYVNMTDKENRGYKEVACGLYVTPSGQVYVLMNFFT